MGCVFGREAPAPSPSPSPGSEVREGRDLKTSAAEIGGKSQIAVAKAEIVVEEVRNGGEKLEKKGERNQKARGERRRVRLNPRIGNAPKSVHGELDAAGWPSWLSAVAGEAIKGWTPRRADSFEKIDKASLSFSHTHTHCVILFCLGFIWIWCKTAQCIN